MRPALPGVSVVLSAKTIPRHASPPVCSTSPGNTSIHGQCDLNAIGAQCRRPGDYGLNTPNSLGFIGRRTLNELPGYQYSDQMFDKATLYNSTALSMDIRRIPTKKIVADDETSAVTSGD